MFNEGAYGQEVDDSFEAALQQRQMFNLREPQPTPGMYPSQELMDEYIPPPTITRRSLAR